MIFKIEVWFALCKLTTYQLCVTRVYCELCSKHSDKLKSLCNFSPAFVGGVTGSALKKDNVVKHSKSDMHTRAVSMSRKPKTRNDIFRATPIGRSLAGASGTEMARVSKLFDLAYVIVKEECPSLNILP